jgi:AraC-like DNA-binding protein
VCNTIKSESFSPLLFAALCSPNFWVATQRIARYKTLVAPMRLDIRESGDSVTLNLVWPDCADSQIKPPPSLVSTELLFFVTLARIGTRETIRPLRMVTNKPPTPAEPYENFLGIRIQRGAGHHIIFKKADMLMPFLTANEGIWAAFEPELRTRLAGLKTEAQVVQRVRSVLLESLPSGLISMNTIASRLAISRRTLQRRLKSEGTTYLLLLQQTREALARHYLLKTQLSTGEIAFLLGFDEPNSFYRAFRTWTGHSPDQVRHQCVRRYASPT